MSGFYRWMKSRRNIVVGHKAKLGHADVEESKASRSVKNETNVDAKAYYIKNVNVDRKVKNALTASPVAYLRAAVIYIRDIVMNRAAKIETADGAVCQTEQEDIYFDLTAKAGNADGSEATSERAVSTSITAKVDKASAGETYTKSVCKLDMSAELFHAISCGADCEKTEIVTHKAAPRFWMMPYVDENGILHVRQAYSAEMNGDILEVR